MEGEVVMIRGPVIGGPFRFSAAFLCLFRFSAGFLPLSAACFAFSGFLLVFDRAFPVFRDFYRVFPAFRRYTPWTMYASVHHGV